MGLRIDPVGVHNFYLTLVDATDFVGTVISLAANFVIAGFSECTGLDASIDVFEYREGGQNQFVHKFPGRASFANIVMKHGVIYLYDDLWTWHNGFVRGEGKRKDGTIVLLDSERRPAKVWKFRRAVPLKWQGPALSGAQSNVAIESLEISHEGLELEVGA